MREISFCKKSFGRKPFFIFSVILATVLFFQTDARAQCVSLTTLGTAYTQNFNTLSNTAGSTTNNLTITGWFLTETGGGARDNEQYAVDTGASTTGDMYSYGAAGNTDRALGQLRSGTLIGTFGACFTNNTGGTIKRLDINYTGEQWRLGTTARTDQINFEYSFNATDLTTGTWTNAAALNFISPDTGTVGAKDGNAAANRTALTQNVAVPDIANGATFWIRWTDTDASGADDGLAVDDFSLTPQTTLAADGVISGRVQTAQGKGIANAKITLINQSGFSKNVITSPFGYFSFEELETGETYIISVSAKNHIFSPQTVSLTENIENLIINSEE